MSIYLDNAATTPLMPEAAQAMRQYYSADFYNPSAAYSQSQKIRDKIEECRSEIAELISAEPEEVFFTSGGTESDNWAINEGTRRRGHIMASAIEHKAVLSPLKEYGRKGGYFELIPVDEDGFVDTDFIKRKIRYNTVMLSVMTANNEIGTIEPIETIAHIAREYDVLFHTDAVQAFGHIPINVKEMAVDMMSASSHKFNGPKGVGFLYIRKDCGVKPFIFGGGQENGMRSGTENVPGIIGMAEAAKLSCKRMKEKSIHCRKLCEYMTGRIMSEIDDVRMNGTDDFDKRLPNNMSFSFKNVDAQSLLVLLDMHGINAAAGSACAGGGVSHVLKAIKTDKDYIGGTIRMSIDDRMNIQTADYVISVLKRMVSVARNNT